MPRIYALLFAFLLDQILGELPNRYHPVVWMGNWIRLFSSAALKSRRIRHNNLYEFLCGAGFMILGILVFSVPLFFLQKGIEPLPDLLQGLILGLFLKPVFSLHDLLKAAAEIQGMLNLDRIEDARRLVSWHLVSRDTSGLSKAQICSATIESVAENLTDSFLSPILAFSIGGLPFAWAYRLVNTGDAMIGYHAEKWEYLGKFTARLDDILNFIPARIAASLICVAAFFTGMDMKRAVSVVRREHARASSPNAGLTIAAAAGALNIRLEKIGAYIFNEEGHDPDSQNIRQSCKLVYWAAAGGLLLSLCILLLIWIH
ncbi:MAG: cobalamin biosynthesis protein [Flexilinea sp.]